MARIGETKCWNPNCGCTDAAVHRTAGGKLHIQCHKCGAAPWGALGTKAHRDIQALTRLDEPDATAAPAAPAAPAPAAPTTQPRRASGLMFT